MVETIFLDWLLSLGVGLVFGRLGAGDAGGRTSRLASPAFRAGALTQVVLMSVSAALYALSDDWMWMYWVDPARLPLGIELLAFAMYVVAFLAGFLLSPELERLGSGATWWALGGVVAAITAIEILAWDELTHLGTPAEFHAGVAPGLGGTFLAVLGIGAPVVVVLGAVLARSLVRDAPG